MYLVEARKIQIASIHDVDGSYFDNQAVEDIDIVNLSCGDDHDRRNVPAQIYKGVEFYSTFASPELGPWEKRQTKVYRCRVQGIDGLIQFDAEGIGGVKISGFCDEGLSEIGVKSPIPVLIGVGKGISRNFPTDAQMIKPPLGCPQTSLDISQTFPIGQLGKGHAEILVPA